MCQLREKLENLCRNTSFGLKLKLTRYQRIASSVCESDYTGRIVGGWYDGSGLYIIVVPYLCGPQLVFVKEITAEYVVAKKSLKEGYSISEFHWVCGGVSFDFNLLCLETLHYMLCACCN